MFRLLAHRARALPQLRSGLRALCSGLGERGVDNRRGGRGGIDEAGSDEAGDGWRRALRGVLDGKTPAAALLRSIDAANAALPPISS